MIIAYVAVGIIGVLAFLCVVAVFCGAYLDEQRVEDVDVERL